MSTTTRLCWTCEGQYTLPSDAPALCPRPECPSRIIPRISRDLGVSLVHLEAEYLRLAAEHAELRVALMASVSNHCRDDKMFCSTCTPARALLARLDGAQ